MAYFQQGVSNFLIGDFEEACGNFNDALLYLRGNSTIDYFQLGLLFKLYSCEVLFNRGLCYMYLQNRELGMADLGFAVKEKQTEDHDVIDEAIAEQAEVRIKALESDTKLLSFQGLSRNFTDLSSGVHRILHSSRCRIQAK